MDFQQQQQQQPIITNNIVQVKYTLKQAQNNFTKACSIFAFGLFCCRCH